MRWVEPARYAFTLESSCGEHTLIGRFRISVVGGAVAEAEGLDWAGRTVAGDPEMRERIPTLGELLVELDSAKSADAAEAVFDPGDGHPTRITIDYRSDVVDDEACYRVSNYATG